MITIIESDQKSKQQLGAHIAKELQSVVRSDVSNGVLRSDGLDKSPFSETVHESDTVNAALDVEQTSPATSSIEVESQVLPHYFHGSSEDILEWPIFQSRHHREQIERLIFDPALHSDLEYSSPASRSVFSVASPRDAIAEPRRRMSSTRGIREEDVSELVERFLTNVHTKNPILDPNALRDMVKSIAGEGFSWDARTCLVVRTVLIPVACSY